MVLDDQIASGNPQPATWSSWHGLTYPVVVDPAWIFAGDYVPPGTGSFGIPAYTVLNRELEMVSGPGAGWLDEALVDSLLSDPIPAVDWPLP